MKTVLLLVLAGLIFSSSFAQSTGDTSSDRKSLERTTAALRDAFGRGDVQAIVALHHPDVEKFFGGNHVVKGRAALEKGLVEMFHSTKMEFIGHKVESLIFTGDAAIETSLFTIRSTPKSGGEPTIAKGRAMVVYVRYKGSPTGWASIREMAQAGPEE